MYLNNWDKLVSLQIHNCNILIMTDKRTELKQEKDDKLFYNGHEFVDLGLSVRWATLNVGASNLWDYGQHFAWGEKQSKKYYDWKQYKFKPRFRLVTGKFTKYNTDPSKGHVDSLTTLCPEDDVANANWGGKWRMPTDEDFKELIENCTWKWIDTSNQEGYLITSNKPGYNDCSIFLPAAGTCFMDMADGYRELGYYWSSSLQAKMPVKAVALVFDNDSYGISDSYRFFGFTVRPVF